METVSLYESNYCAKWWKLDAYISMDDHVLRTFDISWWCMCMLLIYPMEMGTDLKITRRYMVISWSKRLVFRLSLEVKHKFKNLHNDDVQKPKCLYSLFMSSCVLCSLLCYYLFNLCCVYLLFDMYFVAMWSTGNFNFYSVNVFLYIRFGLLPIEPWSSSERVV